MLTWHSEGIAKAEIWNKKYKLICILGVYILDFAWIMANPLFRRQNDLQAGFAAQLSFSAEIDDYHSILGQRRADC